MYELEYVTRRTNLLFAMFVVAVFCFLTHSLEAEEDNLTSTQWLIFWGGKPERPTWATVPILKRETEPFTITHHATIWALMQEELGIDAIILDDGLLQEVTQFPALAPLESPLNDAPRALRAAIESLKNEDCSVRVHLLCTISDYYDRNLVIRPENRVVIALKPLAEEKSRGLFVALSNKLGEIAARIDNTQSEFIHRDDDAAELSRYWKEHILKKWNIPDCHIAIDFDYGFAVLKFPEPYPFGRVARMISGS